MQQGVAALAVSVLGVGAAGSVTLSGAAERPAASTPAAVSETRVEPGVVIPSAFGRSVARPSRSGTRTVLDGADLASRAALRADTLAAAEQVVNQRARTLAAAERKRERVRAAKAKAQAAAKARARARAEAKAKARRAAERRKKASEASLPLTGGYRIAARYGAVGSWSRYHTGYDFSAPVGTPVRAVRAGVVTTAGQGKASGWAGTYVTIRHADGTTSLSAHLGSAAVEVGEHVQAGEEIGVVGLTGRTFGAHLHFEVYPAGVKPDDVYQAMDPEPWLRSAGLRV